MKVSDGEGGKKPTWVRARVFTDLLGLRSCHSNDAPDPLSNGLLGDDDEGPDVNRVLQMAAGEHGATAQFLGSLAQMDKQSASLGERQ